MQGTHRANMEIPNASRIPHPGTPQSLRRGNSPHPVQIHPADDHTFFCPTSIGIRYSRLSPCMFNGWIGMTVRHGTHTLRRQHTDVNTDLSEADTQWPHGSCNRCPDIGNTTRSWTYSTDWTLLSRRLLTVAPRAHQTWIFKAKKK